MAITLTSIPASFDKGTGGAVAVFLIPIDSSRAARTYDISTGIVTFTDVSANLGFTKFVPLRDTLNYTTVGAPNRATASCPYTHTIGMSFGRTDSIKIAAFNNLCATEVLAIVVDKHNPMLNNFICVGHSGMITAATNQSGTAGADLNGFTLSLTSDEGMPSFVVDSTTAAKLKLML